MQGGKHNVATSQRGVKVKTNDFPSSIFGSFGCLDQLNTVWNTIMIFAVLEISWPQPETSLNFRFSCSQSNQVIRKPMRFFCRVSANFNTLLSLNLTISADLGFLTCGMWAANFPAAAVAEVFSKITYVWCLSCKLRASMFLFHSDLRYAAWPRFKPHGQTYPSTPKNCSWFGSHGSAHNALWSTCCKSDSLALGFGLLKDA